MCGIVGFIDSKSQDKEILENMMNAIIHRGPDDSGMYLDDTIALGHRRLSIIDLAGGSQPMRNENGELVCIFNGEIYNFHKLRKELEAAGHRFVTKSDTEVLLHGYEQWGESLPCRLRGMFAFVIWNRKKKELFCARDYFGIKPFYYYRKKDLFLFGSEIKSFLPHPGFEKVLNQEQLELYLTYQYSPGDTTFFQNVYKLLPAHNLTWKDGRIVIQRYWQPEFEPDMTRTDTEWEMDIAAAVQDSVSAHKVSDVEVGCFLSSGVDSSYITCLAKPQKTFTIGFDQQKYDEGECAHRFSEVVKTEHTIYHISPEEYWEKLPEIQYYMDEPLGDASSAALYFLNREASRKVKVCLSGEGADELFGGYHIYKEPFMCGWYEKVPCWMRRAAGVLAECLPPGPGINFLVRHSRSLEDRYIGNTSLFSERQKRKIMKNFCGAIQPTELSSPYFKDSGSADDVTRMQYTDLHLWLVGDILLKADKMSMANSLELRVPFLDKTVFETARKLPTDQRVNKKETKIAFRRAASYLLGEKNAKREKRGFPVPVREWLKEEPYVSYVRKTFESPTAAEFFYKDRMIDLLDEHVKGKKDNWRQIWCVYMFLLWYEEYFVKRK